MPMLLEKQLEKKPKECFREAGFISSTTDFCGLGHKLY